jgi:hypothetical protein
MTKLENTIAKVRSFTRSFLVVELLGVLAFAALFAPGISAETKEHILNNLGMLAGMAVTFYFTKNPEHVDPEPKEEVTNETPPQP